MSEKVFLYGFGPTAAVTVAGLILHDQYGDLAVAVEGALALATAAIGGDKHPAFWAGAGALALGAVVTWAGFDAVSFWAWATTTAASVSARLLFEHNNKHHGIDGRIKETKFATGLARAQMAQVQLAQKTEQLAIGPGSSEPALTGHTPEETAIREAVYELYKQQLPGVHMDYDEWGWRATISLPPGLARARLKREWPEKMNNALALGGMVRLSYGTLGNQLIVRYLAEDPLEATIDYISEDLENVSEDIRLGPDENGDPTLLNVFRRHVLILGTSGNGKSTLMQLLILRLFSAGAACVGIDMKRGVELAPVKRLLQTLATTAEEARAVLEWIDTEVDRRSKIMEDAGKRKWTEDLGPYIWVFVDELSELTAKINNQGLDKDEPTLADLLDQRLRIDRAFGIHFVSATQAPSKQAFGGTTDGRANYKVRISTRLEEAAHAQFAFGTTWKTSCWDPNELLNGPGECLIRTEDSEFRNPIRRKFMMIEDADIDAEVERLAPQKVGLVGAPWGEGGAALSPSQLVERFLRNHGEVTRVEIEDATGLDKKQVLNALAKLADRVARDSAQHTYSWRSERPAPHARAE